jgi:chromosome segregation ATPase
MRHVEHTMRTFVSLAGAALLLAACQTGPANQRGLFTGIAAAVSGDDVKQAQALERQADDQEAKAQRMAQRAREADADAQRTSAQVRSAEQRLATVRADVARQKSQLAALKARQAPGASSAEADRIQAELNQLESAQRAAAAQMNGLTPAMLQELEKRARAVDAALNKLGSV